MRYKRLSYIRNPIRDSVAAADASSANSCVVGWPGKDDGAGFGGPEEPGASPCGPEGAAPAGGLAGAGTGLGRKVEVGAAGIGKGFPKAGLKVKGRVTVWGTGVPNEAAGRSWPGALERAL